MATNRFRGDAPAVAGVKTLTITNASGIAGKTWSVPINGKSVTYTEAASDSNTLVATGLAGLLAASLIPEFQEINWSVANNIITGTDSLPGRSTTVSNPSTNDTANGVVNGATNAAPVVIATTAPHGLTTGDVVVIASVGGNGGANGTFAIIVVDSTHFSLTGSTGTGAYTSGGTWTKTGSIVLASTVTSTGPNDLSTATNWTTGALPVAADNVIFDLPGCNVYYGMEALAAVAPASITFGPTWTGATGLPDLNTTGTTPYYEYRPTRLKSLCTSYTLNSQSGRTFIDCAAAASVTVNVFACGNPLQGDAYAVKIRNCGASSVLNIMDGIVGIATGPGDTITEATVNVGYLNNIQSDVTLTIGTGATLTTINQDGGSITCSASVTTWNLNAGTATLLLAAAITTLNAEDGTLVWQSTGTIGTANIGTGAVLDASQLPLARTLTNCTLNEGGTVTDPNFKITPTNGYILGVGVNLSDVNLNVGPARTIKVS